MNLSSFTHKDLLDKINVARREHNTKIARLTDNYNLSLIINSILTKAPALPEFNSIQLTFDSYGVTLAVGIPEGKTLHHLAPLLMEFELPTFFADDTQDSSEARFYYYRYSADAFVDVSPARRRFYGLPFVIVAAIVGSACAVIKTPRPSTYIPCDYTIICPEDDATLTEGGNLITTNEG